jgi:hypothetical protein
MWVYTLAPLAAGVAAGAASHFHLKLINGNSKLYT